MVESFRKAIEELAKQQNIVLFAILKMDDLTDRWTLIFALNDISNKQEFFDQALTLVRGNISAEEAQNIARIGVFPTDDHLITELLKYPTETELKDIKVNGNYIHTGYIFISRVNSNLRMDV